MFWQDSCQEAKKAARKRIWELSQLRTTLLHLSTHLEEILCDDVEYSFYFISVVIARKSSLCLLVGSARPGADLHVRNPRRASESFRSAKKLSEQKDGVIFL